MDENLRIRLDPVERLRLVKNTAAKEINSAIPINRYYRSLNELYRTAGFCIEDNELERAFTLYLRFVTLAVEELPKHKDFQGFSSLEKKRAEACLVDAFDKAEKLKEHLKKEFELDAERAKKDLEAKEAEAAKKASAPPLVPTLNENASVSNHIKPTSTPHFDEKLPASAIQGPCNMVIAAEIVEKFKRQVERNTSLNIETCAVLCGSMTSGGIYRITHAVIPKQDGAPDSCDMHSEEDIFAFQDTHNLITLGWIHTHPSQTAFLSSVDLHTHCAYQLMLPEAIAIVVAPKFKQTGVFRLTPKGMEEVGNCRQPGFHPHENTNSLFHQCNDIRFDNDLKAEVVDLR